MWIEAIVMPREQPRPAPPSPRRAGKRPSAASAPSSRGVVVARAGEESRCFRDAVLAFLRAHQLMSAVRWVSDPGLFPVVTLHCTPAVLEALRRAPEFEAGLSMPLELTA